MKQCKTCKHWEAYRPNEWGVLKCAGICHAARELWTVTDEQEESEPYAYHLALLPEHSGVRSMVMDGSQYSAKLITMPDFGCVMHES